MSRQQRPQTNREVLRKPNGEAKGDDGGGGWAWDDTKELALTLTDMNIDSII